MINFYYTLITSCIFCFSLTSCIKEEAIGREADIEKFVIQDENVENILIDNNANTLTLFLKDLTIRTFTPQVELSEGASVLPASGTEIDFSNQTVYTVTSEDKSFQKKYKILIRSNVADLKMNFEDWVEISWNATKPELTYWALKDNLWASANYGVVLATLGNIDEYPTSYTTDAYKGKYAAELVTKKGGKYWGKLIPVFSGSIYRGIFSINLGNFVKSAKFGQPHPKENGKPMLFTGYYKYKPGTPFVNEKDEEIPGRLDECSIHAVLYKVTKGDKGKKEYLDGTNILTSDKVIAKAILEDGSKKENYTKFSLEFNYVEEPDYESHDYKLAIVCASSKEGDFYRGAIGSTLIVDNIEVICELIEE